MSGSADDGNGGMTLAFHLDAIEALATPRDAVGDARQWSTHVGVVADDTDAVETAVRRYGIRQDYELDGIDAQSVLSRLKWETETARYVYIGTNESDEALAEYVNWEYLDVATAAEAADWQLRANQSTLDRLRMRLTWRRLYDWL